MNRTRDYAAPAAIVYSVIVAGVIAFQLALAAGMPWGAYARGGTFPGAFPPAMRLAAVVQAILLGLTAAILLSCAGVALTRWSRVAKSIAWVIACLMAVSVVLNAITPSSVERAVWVPVTLVMLLCSLTVALRRGSLP